MAPEKFPCPVPCNVFCSARKISFPDCRSSLYRSRIWIPKSIPSPIRIVVKTTDRIFRCPTVMEVKPNDHARATRRLNTAKSGFTIPLNARTNSKATPPSAIFDANSISFCVVIISSVEMTSSPVRPTSISGKSFFTEAMSSRAA